MTEQTSKDSSNVDFKWLFDTWLQLKQSKDWKTYIFFLREIEKQFSKIYAGFTNEAWIDVMGQILKVASCELQETIIKYNNQCMPEPVKKKTIQEMTDEELTAAYIKGVQWLRDNEQVTGSTKNNLGVEYNDTQYQAGLRRIEKLEDEMSKRGVAI